MLGQQISSSTWTFTERSTARIVVVFCGVLLLFSGPFYFVGYSMYTTAAGQIALLLVAFAPALSAKVTEKRFLSKRPSQSGEKPPGHVAVFFVVATAPLLLAVLYVLGSGAAAFWRPLLTFIGYLPFAWGEERGWRGFLQPMVARGGEGRGVLVSASIWTIWHLPMHVAIYDLGSELGVSLGHRMLRALLLSVVYWWLALGTGHYLVAAVAHAATNTASRFLGPDSSAVLLLWGIVSIFALIALLRRTLAIDHDPSDSNQTRVNPPSMGDDRTRCRD